VSIITGDSSGAYTTSIDVVNLRTGRHRGAFYAGRNDGPNGPYHHSVGKLRISRYGIVAWVGDVFWYGDPPPAPHWYLTAHDSAGTRVLETVEPHSINEIRFRDSTLTWLENGEPRSADLGRR
jgi:hypothetical protein